MNYWRIEAYQEASNMKIFNKKLKNDFKYVEMLGTVIKVKKFKDSRLLGHKGRQKLGGGQKAEFHINFTLLVYYCR